MPELVSRVETGFANAKNYDAYRPSYPEESVSALLEALKVLGVPEARILDLGAGTGKMTQQLVAREERYDIVAVDPHPQMLEVLIQKRLPGVKTMKGTASNMAKVSSEWADAVIVAQVRELSPIKTELLVIHAPRLSIGTAQFEYCCCI
jgi:ubiquinone/menaquinone biosynthesis C-methylase UbiE